MLAFDADGPFEPGAGGHEDGRVGGFEVVQCQVDSQGDTRLEDDSHRPQPGDLLVDDAGGQPVLGNPVAQHPSGAIPPLEYHHLVARPAQVVGGRQAGGAASHDCHSFVGRLPGARVGESRRGVPEPPFDGPDGDRLLARLRRQVAGVFTGMGADPAGDTRERVAEREGEEGLIGSPGGDVVQVGGDSHPGGTTGAAGCRSFGEHRPDVPPRTGLQGGTGRADRNGDLRVVVDVVELRHTATPSTTRS